MKPQVIKDEVDELDVLAKTALPGGAAAPTADPMDAVLKLDELMLEVGMGLVPLVDAQQGGQLLARVKSMRKNLAQQLGFLVPSIHITDNLSLQRSGVCDLSAWGRDRPLGAAPRLSARHQLQRQCTRSARPGYPRTGIRCARQNGSLRRPRDRPLLPDMQSWIRPPCLPLIWRK